MMPVHSAVVLHSVLWKREVRMKILVIFTGGTIGSTLSDGWISPDADKKYQLIAKFREVSSSQAEFDSLTPYTILSENLSSRELNLLIDCVRENLSRDYDGIIVTHGTDTLPFTAAALSLALGGDCLPVVLVSSNYPLEDSRANGLANFAAAVSFIESGVGRGVFVSYKNREERVNFHAGLRLLPHGELTDEVYSVGGPYAFYENGAVMRNPYFRENMIPALGSLSLCETPGMLVVTAFPGDAYTYDLSGVRAIVMRPYHSGTLPTSDPSFIHFCEKAKTAEIPVFVTAVPAGEMYETARLYKEYAVLPLREASTAAVIMQIWAAVSLGKDIRNFVQSYSW